MKKIAFLISHIAVFVLSGCFISTEEASPSTKASSKNLKEKNLAVTPLILSKESFHSVLGWINEEEILYAQQEAHHFDIHSYHVLSGKTELIYKENGLLTQAALSPSKKSILLHQSNKDGNAEVKVINLSALEETWNQIIDSFELVFQWNPYDETKISFTAFQEDWSYSVWFANMKDNSMNESHEMPPFHYWSSSDEIMYQKWSSDNDMMSPLYERTIDDKTEWLVKDESFHFAKSKDYLINVIFNESKQHFSYEVLQGENVTSVFETPALQIYSDFILPEYDFIETNEEMIMFVPDAVRAAEPEENVFKLIKIDLKTGAKTSILNGTSNMPLDCSTGGNFCLAGHQLTSIVSIPKGELKQLFIFEEDIQ